MVTRTFREEITNAEYTKVGDNVTILSATEHLVGGIRVVVVDVGDTQPAVGETQYVQFNDLYARNGDAVDIYMRCEDNRGPTHIEGERQ